MPIHAELKAWWIAAKESIIVLVTPSELAPEPPIAQEPQAPRCVINNQNSQVVFRFACDQVFLLSLFSLSTHDAFPTSQELRITSLQRLMLNVTLQR